MEFPNLERELLFGQRAAPERMHVFATPKLNISLSKGLHYAAVPSTKCGAPFRPITVRDSIGYLPPVENGESETNKILCFLLFYR